MISDSQRLPNLAMLLTTMPFNAQTFCVVKLLIFNALSQSTFQQSFGPPCYRSCVHTYVISQCIDDENDTCSEKNVRCKPVQLLIDNSCWCGCQPSPSTSSGDGLNNGIRCSASTEGWMAGTIRRWQVFSRDILYFTIPGAVCI